MKQQKLFDYTPKYPKKTMRRATLAAAALLALGTTVGCRAQNLEPEVSGAIAIDEPGVEIGMTEDVQTDGMVPLEDAPVEEAPTTTGVILLTPEPEEEEVTLSGDIMVDEQP